MYVYVSGVHDNSAWRPINVKFNMYTWLFIFSWFTFVCLLMYLLCYLFMYLSIIAYWFMFYSYSCVLLNSFMYVFVF